MCLGTMQNIRIPHENTVTFIYFLTFASCPLARLYMNQMSNLYQDLGADGLHLGKAICFLRRLNGLWVLMENYEGL
jgi:predicted metal-binding protein